jgi:hypothetical protein
VSTNIQVNGNVGTINVYGGSALPCDVAPMRSGGQGSAVRLIGKALFYLVGSVFVVLAGGLALGLIAGYIAAIIAFYVVCRLGELLLYVERDMGGSMRRPAGVSVLMRALGRGDNVRELDALAIRETDYVDSN